MMTDGNQIHLNDFRVIHCAYRITLGFFLLKATEVIVFDRFGLLEYTLLVQTALGQQ
jgi:hypothetical protein